jgi:hypothetical protein
VADGTVGVSHCRGVAKSKIFENIKKVNKYKKDRKHNPTMARTPIA